MPYIMPEQIIHAKRMDLLTYLKTYEPKELIRLSDHLYSTRSHDSLKISNGKWIWWSRGIGGRSALDYLIKVRGMSFQEAVFHINEKSRSDLFNAPAIPESEKPKKLILPEANNNNERVSAYLTGRGISREVINYCIDTKRLYESKKYSNAVFVGFDPQGVPRYAALRGTSGSRFMGEAPGSDKRFSFSIAAVDETEKLHLFESAIDLLSFCTLELLRGRDWRREHCLSLAGVYSPKEKINEFTPPAALMQYLKDHPRIDSVALHLDNDEAGRLAANAIKYILSSDYTVSDEPPKRGKDMNDYLNMILRQQRTRQR